MKRAEALIDAALKTGFIGEFAGFLNAVRNRDVNGVSRHAEAVLKIMIATPPEAVVQILGVVLLTYALAGSVEEWRVNEFANMVSKHPSAWARQALEVLQQASASR